MSEHESHDEELRFPDEGSLAHVAPAELVGRLVELGFSGRVLFFMGAAEGEVGLAEGRVFDARALGDFGEPALLRLLGAGAGSYRIERRVSTTAPPQAFGEWPELLAHFEEHRAALARAAERVGGFEGLWAIRYGALSRHLDRLPDAINPLLRRLDGRRPVGQVLTETPLEERLSLRVLARLLSLGILVPDEKADESGPTSSPLGQSLAEEESGSTSLPVIGSDVRVRPQWFDEAHREEEARAKTREGVLAGSLPPATADAPSPDEAEQLLPAPEIDDDVPTLRPLPAPSEGEPLVEPPAGSSAPPEEAVPVTTWSIQAEAREPPPLDGFDGDDAPDATEGGAEEERDDLDAWLGDDEEAFFRSPPPLLEEEGTSAPPVTLPPRPPSRAARLGAAAVLLAGAIVVGYVLGRACSPAPAENWSGDQAASTVDG